MDIGALSVVERGLFNHGILSLAAENNHKDYVLARFTSGLIYRICIDCVFPRRNIQLDTMPSPMLLLETAFRHMSPGQLGIKMPWNLRGPSEHVFQIELYSIFRDLLPRNWRCASEVHEVESMGKAGSNRWRLDLMLLADNTPGPNAVGFELKVDKMSENEIDEAIDQAFKYAKTFKIDVYLVNFFSRLAKPSKPRIICRSGLRVFLINVTYNDSLNEFQATYFEETEGKTVEKGFIVCPAGDMALGP